MGHLFEIEELPRLSRARRIREKLVLPDGGHRTEELRPCRFLPSDTGEGDVQQKSVD